MYSNAMLRRVFIFGLFVLAFSSDAKLMSEEPLKVTVCDLKKDSAAYNHKLVQVTGAVSHGFENFTLLDSACPGWPGVWVEYGGQLNSGTMYCCGVSAARKRTKPLIIEGISLSLVTDQQFHKLDQVVQRRSGSTARATLIGRFFAGKKGAVGLDEWGGFGHMGCCSLFVIQRVVSVEPQSSSR
jgi:hypothetical protein